MQRDPPYLHLYQRLADIEVWIVDGNYIRTHIDEEFTNYGQHYRHTFIPLKEFWIDQQQGAPEEQYYISHLLVEHKLMTTGLAYEQALDKANRIEQAERKKSHMVRNLLKNAPKKIINTNYVHKSQLNYDKCPLRIWLVRGTLVRSLYYNDFTQGGHDQVYDFIPDNEVWLDDDLTDDERPLVLLHELFERHLMMKGMNYPDAHEKASRLEFRCRQNKNILDGYLKQEFSRAKLL